MFAAGDLVVYGGEGVCRVESVGTPDTSGYDKTKEYYTLAPLYRSGQVMTPVDTRVLMRPVMTAAEAAGFLAALPQLPPEAPEGPGQRAAQPQDQPAGRAVSAPGGGAAVRRIGGGAGCGPAGGLRLYPAGLSRVAGGIKENTPPKPPLCKGRWQLRRHSRRDRG